MTVDEGILHIQLMNYPLMGDSKTKNKLNGGGFNNWTKILITINIGTLTASISK